MANNRQELGRNEAYKGGRSDRGKQEKHSMQVEDQFSIENPIVPITTFDLERQLRDYDPIITSLVDRINLLEVGMDTVAIPASPAQHGHQVKICSQIHSKLMSLSGALTTAESVDGETTVIQTLKTNLAELVLRVQTADKQLQESPEKSQAALLRQLTLQMTEVEAQIKKLGIRMRTSVENIDRVAEFKRLRTLLSNLNQYLGEQTGLESSVVVEDGRLIQDLIDLFITKVVSIQAMIATQKVQDELKELERRAPLVKNALAKKATASDVAEKHRALAELRASQADIFRQNPDTITQRMAADMLALNMSYEAFGIPRGLEERVTFPLSERVGVVEGVDPSRSFIIISAYSRKPSGAQGFLLFERFVMEPSKFQQTRQFFSAMANDPRNQNLVLRMIDYAPKTKDSADGVLAQGIVALAERNQSDASLQANKKKKTRPQKKVKKQGPGKYSGRRK